MRNFQPRFFICLLVVTLGGCGGASGPTVNVRGKLLENGQPVKGFKAEGPYTKDVRVTFIQLGDNDQEEGKAHRAEYDQAAGTFQVSGLPAGKYRICVNQQTKTGIQDRFKNEFGRGKSPIIRELTSDQDNLVIDLANPKG